MKFASDPVLRANPNKRAPLAAFVEFATDGPSRAVLEISGPRGTRRQRSDLRPDGRHRAVVAALRPGAACAVRVAAEDAEGGTAEWPDALGFEAPALDPGVPPLEVRTCVPEKREPGAMVFNIRHSPASEHLPPLGLLAAVDRFGDIVWTYRVDEAVGDVRRLRNGNLLYVADGRICEIDMLGDTVAEWYAAGRWAGREPPAGAAPVETGMFHHAAIELPSGNILACSMEIRDVEGFPASEADPSGPAGTAKVAGDVIVEFRRDGTVERRHRLLDLLDPRRVCYGSRSDYWVRRGFPGTCDWSHVNGLAHDPADDGIVASVRHQDCLIKIDRETGRLAWILGTHANWRAPWAGKLLAPAPGLEWQWHQHDCSITPSGTVLCFDNGNHRAAPPEPGMPDDRNYSRVVEFEVDAARRQVRQVWARGPEEDGTFSAFQSGAFRLPETGNTFVDYGGVCTVDGAPSADVAKGRCLARLVEATTEGEVVFEMVADDRSSGSPAALSSFRAEHLPGFGEAGA